LENLALPPDSDIALKRPLQGPSFSTPTVTDEMDLARRTGAKLRLEFPILLPPGAIKGVAVGDVLIDQRKAAVQVHQLNRTPMRADGKQKGE
jgi:hypothetical protein